LVFSAEQNNCHLEQRKTKFVSHANSSEQNAEFESELNKKAGEGSEQNKAELELEKNNGAELDAEQKKEDEVEYGWSAGFTAGWDAGWKSNMEAELEGEAEVQIDPAQPETVRCANRSGYSADFPRILPIITLVNS
jgi:hypothetical protein